jgi:hypothetical protein
MEDPCKVIDPGRKDQMEANVPVQDFSNPYGLSFLKPHVPYDPHHS